MNKSLKIFVMAAVMLSILSLGQTASAWWGHAWGGPFWGPRAFAYPAYSYGWYGGYYGWYGSWYGGCCGWADPCCAPVVDACCAPAAVPAADCVTCDPVCDTCGPVYAVGGYATNYVLGWRPGPIRRLLFGRYRWYATGYVGGYYYTPDCCLASYDVGTPVQDAAPVNAAPTPAPADADAPAAGNSSVVAPEAGAFVNSSSFHQVNYMQKEGVPENSGILTIYVPHDAVVYVNDKLTSTTGSSRSFVSFGLTSGNEYDYVIRAEVTRDGQRYVETKVVTLKAGQKDAVSFTFSELTSGNQVAAL